LAPSLYSLLVRQELTPLPQELTPGIMVGVCAGANGALGVSHIASKTVNLLKVISIKKRAPDAGATALYCSLECGAKNDGERKNS